MPDIDRTADVKVTTAHGTVTAEIPLAGHASEHWLELFRGLASKRRQEVRAETEEREDRTWVLVMLPDASKPMNAESVLDVAGALIGEATRMEEQFQSEAAQTEAVIRGWWERQQR